ncbi:MAG: membrane dipeptidase [Planctomycetes bacterium]|nr:membrane dipeptidase [Planctomycetota bacterium]
MRPLPVFDAHVDSLQLALDLGADLGRRGPGHLDLVRAREGGLGAVVLTAWVSPDFGARPGGHRARAEALLDELHALAARHPDACALVTDGAELAAARAAGRIALIAGMEGGHPLDDDLAALEHFWRRGLRVLTLCWNNHLAWVRSCVAESAGPDTPAGLSELGRRMVRRCNELGIVVDLSHAAPQSFRDALDASCAPVIASHSGCKALHEHPRNLADDELRALAANGGVVGLPFLPSFLDADAQRAAADARAEPAYRALQAADDTALGLAQLAWLRERVPPLSIERLVDHVLHAIDVAGVEHVGLGSDFDGIQVSVGELDDASCYGRLVEPLLRRGLSEREVELVLGANFERVFAAVTAPR